MAVPFAPPIPRPVPRLAPYRPTAGTARPSAPSLHPLDRVPRRRRHGQPVTDPRPLASRRPGPAPVPVPTLTPAPRVAMPVRPRPARAVYLRRRLVLATVATLAVLGAIRLSPGFSGGGPLAASGEPGSARPAAARTYVVQPGDTVWSIAHRFVPKGDERPLVDAITTELNGASLLPGQAIAIP